MNKDINSSECKLDICVVEDQDPFLLNLPEPSYKVPLNFPHRFVNKPGRPNISNTLKFCRQPKSLVLIKLNEEKRSHLTFLDKNAKIDSSPNEAFENDLYDVSSHETLINSNDIFDQDVKVNSELVKEIVENLKHEDIKQNEHSIENKIIDSDIQDDNLLNNHLQLQEDTYNSNNENNADEFMSNAPNNCQGIALNVTEQKVKKSERNHHNIGKHKKVIKQKRTKMINKKYDNNISKLEAGIINSELRNKSSVESDQCNINSDYIAQKRNSVCDNISHERKHGNSEHQINKVHVEKLLRCESLNCDYQTRFKQSLKIHEVKKHSGQRTIACEMCSYRCYLMCELKKHHLSHSNETPFKCDYPGCQYACRLSSNLIKHKRIHTGERPYACDQCNFRSSFVSSLKVHKRTHTNERPFCCERCGYRFNSTSNLKKHTLQKHFPITVLEK